MRFGLVLSEAANGLRRNASMVVSVVLVTFISLTFVGTAALMQLQIAQMKNYWYDRAQVAVYLCTSVSTAAGCTDGEATEEQKAAVESQLGSDTLAPFIDEFYFEDHQQAFENFQEQFEGTPAADYVTPEVLNETFWVNLVDPSQAAVLAASLAGLAGVEQVVDQRRYLDQIFDVLNAASYTAIAVAAIMLVAAALLIATTAPAASSDPMSPANTPSSTKGVWMKRFEAPTSLMMPSSRRRENADRRMVVAISRAAATSMIAATAIAV